MRSRLFISIALLLLVVAGGMLNARVARGISDRYVSAAEELLVLTESGQWQRAADTAGAYHASWEKTLSWLQILINHEDGDSLSRALLMVESGIRYILNYAPVFLSAPPEVYIQNENPTVPLTVFLQHIRSEENKNRA